MKLSKTYTEKELYVDDIDQSEVGMKCNICEKEIPRLAISWDKIPMLITPDLRIKNTQQKVANLMFCRIGSIQSCEVHLSTLKCNITFF